MLKWSCTWLGSGVQIDGAFDWLCLGCSYIFGFDGLMQMTGIHLQLHLQPLQVRLDVLHTGNAIMVDTPGQR